MPTYPQFLADLQTARATYLQDLGFAAAYEENYLANLTKALDEVERANLHTPPNRAALTGQTLNNYHFAADFNKLNRAGILIQATLNALILHIEASASLTEGFLTLHQEGILMENISLLAQAPQLAPRLALGLVALHQAGISNPAGSTLLLKFPQLIPVILLLNKNNLLDKIKISNLVLNLPYINGLTAVLTELAQANFLNKDSYPEALKTATRAEQLSIALRELRQAGRLKENFSTLIEKSENSDSLGSAVFNFNYGEIPLSQADLDLLFKQAPHAEPLSLFMIDLSHQNLLETYRPLLAEQGHLAQPLLKLSYKLKQTKLFIPENIRLLFHNIQNVEKILRACEEHPSLTQQQFNQLVGRIQAERRISLLLGSSGFGAGNTKAPFFNRRLDPVATESRPSLSSKFKPG